MSHPAMLVCLIAYYHAGCLCLSTVMSVCYYYYMSVCCPYFYMSVVLLHMSYCLLNYCITLYCYLCNTHTSGAMAGSPASAEEVGEILCYYCYCFITNPRVTPAGSPATVTRVLLLLLC